MSRFTKGNYRPQYPEKYVGDKAPVYRSSWELKFMKFIDCNENVTKWASEPVSIPYRNPLTYKIANYIPDFVVQYETTQGENRTVMVEVKPKRQSWLSEARTKADRAAVQVNQAKWGQAIAYCKERGMSFKVINEDQIFYNPNRRKR